VQTTETIYAVECQRTYYMQGTSIHIVPVSPRTKEQPTLALKATTAPRTSPNGFGYHHQSAPMQPHRQWRQHSPEYTVYPSLHMLGPRKRKEPERWIVTSARTGKTTAQTCTSNLAVHAPPAPPRGQKNRRVSLPRRVPTFFFFRGPCMRRGFLPADKRRRHQCRL
jgi:hypothetical protein